MASSKEYLEYILEQLSELEDIYEFVSVMTTESKIILSGFYEQDAEAILQKANELGLKENQRLLNHDWCCLLLIQDDVTERR